MGPFVNLRRGLLASLLGTASLLAACERECIPVQRTTPLPAPYNEFFSRLATCGFPAPPPVPASSSTGLTDSFTGSCVSAELSYSATNSGCVTTLFERRRLFNQASLYGFSFSTQIEQTLFGPQLVLRDQSSNNNTSSTELTYYFQGGQTTLKGYDTSFSPIVFGQLPVVTELTNFASGSRTYAQVWRITNPLNAAQGRATAATAYYIDRDYGLIRFDQRDGTSWVLAL
jgi:hypothetical protein